MSTKRKILACLVAIGLIPGTFWRAEYVPFRGKPRIVLIEKDFEPAAAGPMQLDKAWEIRGSDLRVGGFSSLLVRSGTSLLVGTDAGRLLVLRREGDWLGQGRLIDFAHWGYGDGFSNDMEALTWDPESDRIWASFEYDNAIERFGPDLKSDKRKRPQAMDNWPDNSGPEAMTRLADGRFLVIAEGDREGTHPAVLFAGDPVRPRARAMRFGVELPDDYRPVDLAQLADGRVLVLLRRWSILLPFRFESAIAIGDPDEIARDEIWRPTIIAKIEDPLPSENYEGIAVENASDGETYVWLVADDNFMQHQHSYLLRLRWTRERARR